MNVRQTYQYKAEMFYRKWPSNISFNTELLCTTNYQSLLLRDLLILSEKKYLLKD